jgi:hypothetical protein
MAEGYITEIRKRLSDRIVSEERETGKGGATSWENYKERVGKVKGLRDASNIVENVVQRYFDEHD